jgi:hypothetical protein
MKQKKATKVILLVLAILFISTPFFARAKTKYFSAYGACRYSAMHTKGYAMWRHTKTTAQFLTAEVEFEDGFNTISCQTIGIGPFWIPGIPWTTLVGCSTSLPGETFELCPEGYFGVSP